MTALALAPAPISDHAAPAQEMQEAELISAVWDYIRHIDRHVENFGPFDLATDPLDKGQYNIIRRALRCWVADGIMFKVSRPTQYFAYPKYAVMAAPPPVNEPPQPERKPRKDRKDAPGLPPLPKTQRQRLWTAMRVLVTFDLATLVMAAEAPRGRARELVGILERAGWLRRTGAGWTTRTGRTWSPMAPTISRQKSNGLSVLHIIEAQSGAVTELALNAPAEDSADTHSDGGG